MERFGWKLVCTRLPVSTFPIASFQQSSFVTAVLAEHIPFIASVFSHCFYMSSERIDRLVSYIPYAVAFLLVVLYFVFVLPHIQDYIVAAAGYLSAAQKAAHAQEFPRGCSPVTRYNRPVFEIFGLY